MVQPVQCWQNLQISHSWSNKNCHPCFCNFKVALKVRSKQAPSRGIVSPSSMLNKECTTLHLLIFVKYLLQQTLSTIFKRLASSAGHTRRWCIIWRNSYAPFLRNHNRWMDRRTRPIPKSSLLWRGTTSLLYRIRTQPTDKLQCCSQVGCRGKEVWLRDLNQNWPVLGHNHQGKNHFQNFPHCPQNTEWPRTWLFKTCLLGTNPLKPWDWPLLYSWWSLSWGHNMLIGLSA